MGTVATCRTWNASNVALLKPKRSGVKLLLFAGEWFCTVMVTFDVDRHGSRLGGAPVNACALLMPTRLNFESCRRMIPTD